RAARARGSLIQGNRPGDRCSHGDRNVAPRPCAEANAARPGRRREGGRVMVCRDVADRISAFMDDELDPVTSREVSQHVESCASCAAELGSQRQLGDSLRRELDYHRTPDLLRARLMRELGASERREAGPARRAVPALRWLSTAAALVAVAGG